MLNRKLRISRTNDANSSETRSDDEIFDQTSTNSKIFHKSKMEQPNLVSPESASIQDEKRREDNHHGALYSEKLSS